MLVTKYRHRFVYKLDGISMNRIDGEVEVIEDSATGLLAVVTSDPDDYCLEGNRYNATAPGDPKVAKTTLHLGPTGAMHGGSIRWQRVHNELNRTVNNGRMVIDETRKRVALANRRAG